MKNIVRYLFVVILIPVVSVALSLLLRIAQGERLEEVLFGIIVGIVLDIIYCLYIVFCK